MYRTALVDSPHESAALHRLGVLLAKRGELPQAEEHLRAALVHAPGNVELMNDLGYCCYLQKRHADAEVAYRRALEINPRHETSRNNLARVMRERALAETRSYPQTPAAQVVVTPTAPAASPTIKIQDVPPAQPQPSEAPSVVVVEQQPLLQPKNLVAPAAPAPPSRPRAAETTPSPQPPATRVVKSRPSPPAASSVPAIVLQIPAAPPAEKPTATAPHRGQEAAQDGDSCLTFVEPNAAALEASAPPPSSPDEPTLVVATDPEAATTAPAPAAEVADLPAAPEPKIAATAESAARKSEPASSPAAPSTAPAPMPVVRLASVPQGERESAPKAAPAGPPAVRTQPHPLTRVARATPVRSEEVRIPSALPNSRSEAAELRTGHHAGHAEPVAAADAPAPQEGAPRRRSLFDAVMGMSRPEPSAAANVAFEEESSFTEYSTPSSAPATRAEPAAPNERMQASRTTQRRTGFRSSLRAFNPFSGDGSKSSVR
jgi:hypothetical protein